MDRNRHIGPLRRRLVADPLEGLQRERLERFVIQPQDAASGIMVSHESDERCDRAVAVARDEGRHRGGIQRPRSHGVSTHLFSIPARNG